MTQEELNKQVKLGEALDIEYRRLKAEGKLKESAEKERMYSVIRIAVIDDITQKMKVAKSITLDVLSKMVSNKPKRIKYQTGVSVLDYELTSEQDKLGHIKGGFTLGNFIQLAGAKGAGKTSLIVKILCGFSLQSKVSWFNFEMGEDKVIDIVSNFAHTKENLYYYDGKRDIEDICDEIKYLYQSGVRHFLIDSMMKISAKGHERGYASFSYISAVLSELTSRLGINVYLINQVSQDTERGGGLHMKHGNDAEYDSDYIFFIVKPFQVDINNKIVTVDGNPIFDESRRVLHCTKNRDTHRLFRVDINHSDIFGIKPLVIEYEG